MSHRKLIAILTLITLPIAGCFEVDSISIEIDKDLTSSLEFSISESGQNNTKSPSQLEELGLERLSQCGFEVTEIAEDKPKKSFLVNQYFANLSELEEGVRCFIDEKYLQFALAYQKGTWDEVYKLSFKTPNFPPEEWQKRLQNSALDNKVAWHKIKSVRISLPGEMTTNESFGDEIQFKKSMDDRTIVWDLNDQNHSEDQYWLISRPLEIEVSSTLQNLERKWLIKVVIISVGLILTIIAGFYWLNSKRLY